jgi:hypothetical protein
MVSHCGTTLNRVQTCHCWLLQKYGGWTNLTNPGPEQICGDQL